MPYDNLQNMVGMTDTQAGTVINRKGFASNLLFTMLVAAGLIVGVAQVTVPTGTDAEKGKYWLNTSGTAAGTSPTTAGTWNKHDGTAFVVADPIGVVLTTFTGTTIPDDATVEEALQALETAIELRPTNPITPIGSWDASTNTPDLTLAANQVTGHLYRVSASGTTDLDGITDWAAGDDVWRGEDGAWHKTDNTETAASALTFLAV